tara:strand:- start:335 stop:586 length:252 start_codon:yes stop_codon:yes gene_type:complete
MKNSLLNLVPCIFLSLLLIFSPVELQASEIDSPIKEIEPSEKVEASSQMTQEEINNIFGEDPYLGQTSYLQSPDSFSQREFSK